MVLCDVAQCVVWVQCGAVRSIVCQKCLDVVILRPRLNRENVILVVSQRSGGYRFDAATCAFVPETTAEAALAGGCGGSMHAHLRASLPPQTKLMMPVCL